jgi:hypothetical protein
VERRNLHVYVAVFLFICFLSNFLFFLGKEVIYYNLNEVPGYVTHEKCGAKFLVGIVYIFIDLQITDLLLFVAICPNCNKPGQWEEGGFLECSCGNSFYARFFFFFY